MYAILRTAKLKTAGNCGGLNKHLERTMDVPNADKDLTHLNTRYIGSGDLAKDVAKRIKEAGIDKPRKNAVLAVEHLMTASPEAFEFKKKLDPQSGKASLVGSKEMVKKWTAFEEHCHQWLKEQYGEKNIVNFTTHVDEQTPHIHAVIVPIDPKGKLNCRAYLGGREKLRGLQDSFAQAHQGIGLERGIKGSKANHTTVKAFYAHANEFTQAPSLDIALPPFQASIQLPQTNFAGIMKQHPGEYKESQEKLVKAQLEVQQKKVVEQAKDKMRELHQVAIAAEVLKKENDKLKGELKGLQQQIKESTQKQAQLSSKLTNQTTKTQSLIHYLLSGKISKAELGQAIEQVPAKEDKRQESIRALLTEMGIAVKQAQVEQKIDGKLTQQEKPKGPKHNLP